MRRQGTILRLMKRPATDTTPVFNPPMMTGSNGSQSYQQFRGVRTLYTVYDTTAPLSQRYLLWQEPGTWSQPLSGMPGIEYFLSANGLTEAEFLKLIFARMELDGTQISDWLDGAGGPR